MRGAVLALALALGCADAVGPPDPRLETRAAADDRFCYPVWIEHDEYVVSYETPTLDEFEHFQLVVVVDTLHIVDAGIACVEYPHWIVVQQ